MIWFCNIITADLCEKLNPKKNWNSKESLINGLNKPFMGLFLFTDSMIIGDEIERIVIGVEKRSVILHISKRLMHNKL